MATLTPLQEVRQQFGSKEELINQLRPLLERREDIDEEEWERRVSAMSNKKLLRLHRAHQVVTARFGSKDQLVDALVRRKFPKGNEPYAQKLSSLRATRLLDLYGIRY